MCLILFALNKHPKYKLILAANRDEFYQRPTLSADFWDDNKSILGGKDVKSGGTWLGINKNGRFIAITNYRNPKNENKDALSRGEISKNFLTGELSVTQFIKQLSVNRHDYNGFNLLLSDNAFDTFLHYSNITNRLEQITNDYHGLSNHLLDTAWPKVTSAIHHLRIITKSKEFGIGELIKMLTDNQEAPEKSLPSTGISLELEKKLSPVFISMKDYGTRCSTALLVTKQNDIVFYEVTYDHKKQIIAEKQFDLSLKY